MSLAARAMISPTRWRLWKVWLLPSKLRYNSERASRTKQDEELVHVFYHKQENYSSLISIRPGYFLLCGYKHRPRDICQAKRSNTISWHFNPKPSQCGERTLIGGEPGQRGCMFIWREASTSGFRIRSAIFIERHDASIRERD